jgi:hypothetical protein
VYEGCVSCSSTRFLVRGFVQSGPKFTKYVTPVPRVLMQWPAVSTVCGAIKTPEQIGNVSAEMHTTAASSDGAPPMIPRMSVTIANRRRNLSASRKEASQWTVGGAQLDQASQLRAFRDSLSEASGSGPETRATIDLINPPNPRNSTMRRDN